MLSLLVLRAVRWATKGWAGVRGRERGGRLSDSLSLRSFPPSVSFPRNPASCSESLARLLMCSRLGWPLSRWSPSHQIGYCEWPSRSLYTVQLLTWGQACPTWCPAPAPMPRERGRVWCIPEETQAPLAP